MMISDENKYNASLTNLSSQRIQFAKAKSHIILRKEGIPIEKAGATQPLGGKRGREEEADEDEPVTKDARTV